MLQDRVCAIDVYPPQAIPFSGVTPFRIEGLRITFSVKKDLKKDANETSIKVYNLGPSRKKIWGMHSEIQLLAGYASHCGLLRVFNGDITEVWDSIEGVDVITNIVARDGYKALTQTAFTASYSAGTSSKKVQDDIVSALGLPVKFSKAIQGSPLLQGFAHFGTAESALDKLVARHGLEWSVQDRHVQILEQGEGNDDSRDIVLLTPQSGLIGSPERLNRQESEPKNEEVLNGWRIRSLLNPDIRPGSWVAVRSKAIPEVTAFRVDAVEHKGDTHGQDWESVADLRGPGVRP